MSESPSSDDGSASDAHKSGHSSTETGTNSDSKDIDKIKSQLSKKESGVVLKLRIIVLSVLLVVAIGVSLTIYFTTSNSETEAFESQFKAAAEKIVTTFDEQHQKLGAIKSVIAAATIHGVDWYPVQKWPFISLSSFQQRSASARRLADVLMVQFLPVVNDVERDVWERYAVSEGRLWIEDALEYQKPLGFNDFESNPRPLDEVLMINYTEKPIFHYNEKFQEVVDPGPGPYLPTWQTNPVLKNTPVNQNTLKSADEQNHYAWNCVEKGVATIGGFTRPETGGNNSTNPTTSLFSTLRSIQALKESYYYGAPFSWIHLPVFDSFATNSTVVSVVRMLLNWRDVFENILPENTKGVIVVLNSCDGSFTFDLQGDDAFPIGLGDLHDPKFDAYLIQEIFEGNEDLGESATAVFLDKNFSCFYGIDIYPSQIFYEEYKTSTPAIITAAVMAASLFTILMFLLFNHLVEKRQHKVLTQAAASTAIVSSLFPKEIQERLMKQQEAQSKQNNGGLKSFLTANEKECNNDGSEMADFFPDCTVMFADIAGFTAWSSTREPAQIFTLLQTLFQCFDSIAKKRKVYKVETIGDCYVAVTGLPVPQIQHAVVMARFVFQCKTKVTQLTRELELRLGPGTADLDMRFGLHSGPVTAGVVKGDRQRFQLFGDTVNTASRMESTGYKGKIHISQATANLLIAAGNTHWVKPREELVDAKGKGSMKTFWLNPGARKYSSAGSSSNGDAQSECSSNGDQVSIQERLNAKQERMIDWMVEILMERIRKMVATRPAKKSSSDVSYTPPAGTICLDEVKEIIPMSKFSYSSQDELLSDNQGLALEAIDADLKEYVSLIANMYHTNPFHNFEHACHVTMSVNKLLMRITTKEINENDHSSCYTVSLCSDQLVAFAIVFSGLIHDVDHRGCSNLQLIKEQPYMGTRYREKSVAEQNSLDVAWNALMEERFDRLRSAIFANQDELLRFRQIIVNCVLATDIFDKELNDLRKVRWTKAFSETEAETVDHLDMKATIVIEHIIQASDVSHTMQHWHIYRKWNTCLFKELYRAFKAGRMGVDPATFWYKGEIGFFDNYVIPLAKKLKDCNVFGVSSDEFLNYAISNRAEWEEQGQRVVEELVMDLTQEHENVVDKKGAHNL